MPRLKGGHCDDPGLEGSRQEGDQSINIPGAREVSSSPVMSVDDSERDVEEEIPPTVTVTVVRQLRKGKVNDFPSREHTRSMTQSIPLLTVNP